jgi:hypothetical protein
MNKRNDAACRIIGMLLEKEKYHFVDTRIIAAIVDDIFEIINPDSNEIVNEFKETIKNNQRRETI